SLTPGTALGKCRSLRGHPLKMSERHLAHAVPANAIFPMDSELRFFDPRAHVRITHHNLPHWQQIGATYFVTFRLADSLPSTLLDRWRNERQAWIARHPHP